MNFYNRSAIIIDRLLEDLKYFVSHDKLETMSNKLEKVITYLLQEIQVLKDYNSWTFSCAIFLDEENMSFIVLEIED